MKGITLAGKMRRRKRRIRRILGLLLPTGAAILWILVQGNTIEQTNHPSAHTRDVFQFIQNTTSQDPLSDAWFLNNELYMGIDSKGNLVLYEGSTEKKKPIETFFQLDIEYLETSLPHETVGQLYEGIRIRDLEEYNSVLSSLSVFISQEEMTQTSSN